jgi:isocitrate dehydrogenase
MIPRTGLRLRPLARALAPAAAPPRRGLSATAARTRIAVANPVVEIDGDEMARIIWAKIRDGLVLPHVDVDLRYYDLSFENRDATDDQVTVDAAHAILEHNVGVKAATITGTPERLEEFGFTKLHRSPNGTIRNILDGVVMREPIVCKNVPRLVTTWKSPIVIARHAHGDQYRAQDFATHRSGGTLTVRFEPNDKAADVVERVVHEFDGPGVALAMYNTDKSIEGFARGSLAYARSRGLPCILGTKNTILKAYDLAFVSIFAKIAAEEFPDVKYEMRLIDDLVAYMLKNEDPVLYALKNYDGDVISGASPAGRLSLAPPFPRPRG